MLRLGEEYWNGPGAVAVTYRDGRRETVTFDTRAEAEVWLGLLPWRMGMGDDEVADIASAILVGAAVLRPEDVAAALSWN
jgi:hypothetical protein